MTAPQGSDLQFGYGLELADNRPKTINKFARVKSISSYKTTRPLERNPNIDPNRQTVRGVNAAASLMTKIDLAPSVDVIAPFLAHQCGNYAITNPAGSVYQMISQPLLPGVSAPATYVDSLAFETSVNDGYPLLTYGNRMQDLDIKIAENKITECSMSFMGCYESYMSTATFATDGGTATGRWLVRGHLSNPTVGANALKIKCTDAGGTGVAQVEMTQGATVYATPKQTITYNTWYRVLGPASVRYGVNRFEDLWVMYSSDGGSGGTLSVNDEWTWSSTRTAATASYSTLNVLQAAGVDVTVDGTLYYFHTADIKISRGRKGSGNIGDKYHRTVTENGGHALTVSLGRDYEDRTFLQKLISATSIALSVKMYGEPLSAAYDELWQIDAANCQIKGTSQDVTNPNTLSEKIELEAFRSGSTQIYTHTVVNTTVSL